jgi:hypothetical protein
LLAAPGRAGDNRRACMGSRQGFLCRLRQASRENDRRLGVYTSTPPSYRILQSCIISLKMVLSIEYTQYKE